MSRQGLGQTDGDADGDANGDGDGESEGEGDGYIARRKKMIEGSEILRELSVRSRIVGEMGEACGQLVREAKLKRTLKR